MNKILKRERLHITIRTRPFSPTGENNETLLFMVKDLKTVEDIAVAKFLIIYYIVENI